MNVATELVRIRCASREKPPTGWFLGSLEHSVVISESVGDREWHAGTASVVITPDSSMRMAGYGAREEPAEGTLQDLHAKAVALSKWVTAVVDRLNCILAVSNQGCRETERLPRRV